MGLLRKENWFVCLMLSFLSQGMFAFVLAYFMEAYEKDAWYRKWQYWVFGALCFIFPIFIMFYVFEIQMMVKVASKLEVTGKEIYDNPYTWILCLIVPVIGWILLIVMSLYLQIFTIVALYKGNGEKYLYE